LVSKKSTLAKYNVAGGLTNTDLVTELSEVSFLFCVIWKVCISVNIINIVYQ